MCNVNLKYIHLYKRNNYFSSDMTELRIYVYMYTSTSLQI
jgi:hypothetical protein